MCSHHANGSPAQGHWRRLRKSRGTIHKSTVVVGAGIVCLVVSAISRADDRAAQTGLRQYQLVEEWSVAAQGPVHLREKRVKETYQLEVVEREKGPDGERRLQLRVVGVVVDAEIPAQKRRAHYDSAKSPRESPVTDHEIARPMALFGRTLELTYGADGNLTGVAGTEAVSRRLDEIYDKGLRGSEQDLYTREFERGRLSEAELCRSWRDLFVVREGELAEGAGTRERKGSASFTACIPSESWMTRVTVPVAESVRVVSQAGIVSIENTAVLAESQKGEGAIGGATWSYEPKELKREWKIEVGLDGQIRSVKSSLAAVLATTLTLGADIPIQMTIRQTTELSKR